MTLCVSLVVGLSAERHFGRIAEDWQIKWLVKTLSPAVKGLCGD